ncbi:MAG: hypothetical protein U0X93_05820 [Anaerolineales bacterium]
MRLLVFILMRATIRALRTSPKRGFRFLLVGNHSGDADVVLGAAVIPHPAEWIGKIENRDDHWFVVTAFRAYGFIWIHRGIPTNAPLRVVPGRARRGTHGRRCAGGQANPHRRTRRVGLTAQLFRV